MTATICDDAAVQLLLLQVVLGNEHKFTKKALAAVLPACPDRIFLWRQKSAWNSHATMRAYTCLLCKCLGTLLRERYVILVLDGARAHVRLCLEKPPQLKRRSAYFPRRPD